MARPLRPIPSWLIFDEQDREYIASHNWYITAHGYARGAGDVYLHRVLAGARRGDYVDHINGNRLDNRRANLRLCTQSLNSGNGRPFCTSKTGVRGVYYHPETSRRRAHYSAQIMIARKRILLGNFTTLSAASKAVERYYPRALFPGRYNKESR